MLWGELKSQCFDVIGFLANFQAASWKSIWREIWGGKLYILDTQHNIIYIGLFLINKLLPEIPSWHPKVQRSSNRKEVLSKDWRGVSGTRWREDNTAQEHDKILMVLNNIERSRAKCDEDSFNYSHCCTQGFQLLDRARIGFVLDICLSPWTREKQHILW